MWAANLVASAWALCSFQLWEYVLRLALDSPCVNKGILRFFLGSGWLMASRIKRYSQKWNERTVGGARMSEVRWGGHGQALFERVLRAVIGV